MVTFIPNTSPPTFEFEFQTKEVQRDEHSQNRPFESYVLPPPDISALNVRVLESFRVGAVRGDASKSPWVHWPRYDAIMVLPTDRKSTRLNSSHSGESRMPSSA